MIQTGMIQTGMIQTGMILTKASEYSVIILGARRLVYSLYMIQPSPMTKNTRSGFQWDVVDILGK